ncbi:hypothetical protein DFH94DRAFT_828864 [Russula ochroleuca]|jgi:hypothetical protein|uniref:Uncharacterized protein n=1 Tax=Russula ochroleuca TaxID=152965 RepID=A0A9P5MXD7_9AGAM|nr:hypothetical protein DFH94DRAFT_828864 [Russula ochroleuca]
MARPDPPRVPIPLTWLESTFNTRARTEQLLRPELDDGLITQRDFDAAVDFFPGAQRYYTIAGGIIGTLSIIVYGQMLRRPPIPVNRIASLSAVASAGGVIGGTVVRANAHADFFRDLDNQPAFFQAIDNIQSRLGEKPSDQHTTPAYPYPGSDNENQEMADSAVSSRRSWEESTVNRAAVGPNPSPTQPSQRKSRWEEIRAEHARSIATRSSWDELRQNASRPKSENTASDQARRSQDLAVDRLAEQQKFDAMLEAERQRAARG